MKTKKIIFLGLFSLLIFSPIISFTIKAVTPTDSVETPDTLISGDVAPKVLVYQLEIEGAIGTVTNDRIDDAIEIAEDDNAELLLITLNTPGGFSNATRKICTSILNSKVPVCVYIWPSGAHAGSAGVYIAYSAHFSAMAHSTNIGSAHPVGGGGEQIDSVMNEKVTNDAVAQIKASAEKWGRNKEWAEKAVRESVNVTDTEALELNVIDIRAVNFDDLMAQINGRETQLPTGNKVMNLKNYEIEKLNISFAQKLLTIITDPNIVFILMSIGGLGIILELYHPGAILPGVVGAISLIVAFYGMQTLPINYAGLALIVLAAILFIAEIKIVSHGMLTVGGVVSLFFGGLMLIDSVDPNLGVSISLLVTIAICIGLVVGLASYFVIKAQKRKPFSGNEGMVGKIADVRSSGMAYVDGALWQIECDQELVEGDKVEVIELNSLKLKVKKI